jgi:hypothetical protein
LQFLEDLKVLWGARPQETGGDSKWLAWSWQYRKDCGTSVWICSCTCENLYINEAWQRLKVAIFAEAVHIVIIHARAGLKGI